MDATAALLCSRSSTLNRKLHRSPVLLTRNMASSHADPGEGQHRHHVGRTLEETRNQLAAVARKLSVCEDAMEGRGSYLGITDQVRNKDEYSTGAQDIAESLSPSSCCSPSPRQSSFDIGPTHAERSLLRIGMK